MKENPMSEPKNGNNGNAEGQDLAWIRNGLDPEQMARLAAAEIEEARRATSRPRHWRPVEVDPSQLR